MLEILRLLAIYLWGGVNLEDRLSNIETFLKTIITFMNSAGESGVVKFPSGLKIFWGSATLASAADPAGVRSVNINFPEAFESNGYFFIATDQVIPSSNSTKAPHMFNYYQRTNKNIWVGSTKSDSRELRWLAIGI